MAYSCGRKETQRTLFDVPSYSPSARQRRGKSGEFHLVSVTQPPQFYMEFVIFLSFERRKGEDWKLGEGVGTKYLNCFAFCLWLCQWFTLYIVVNNFVSTVYFSLWKMGTLVLIASTYLLWVWQSHFVKRRGDIYMIDAIQMLYEASFSPIH